MLRSERGLMVAQPFTHLSSAPQSNPRTEAEKCGEPTSKNSPPVSGIRSLRGSEDSGRPEKSSPVRRSQEGAGIFRAKGDAFAPAHPVPPSGSAGTVGGPRMVLLPSAPTDVAVSQHLACMCDTEFSEDDSLTSSTADVTAAQRERMV
ncbi:hypothetical protein MRX96_025840 [Rhipicephalus microplus]